MGRGRDDDENRRIQQGMAEGEEVGNLQEKEREQKGVKLFVSGWKRVKFEVSEFHFSSSHPSEQTHG